MGGGELLQTQIKFGDFNALTHWMKKETYFLHTLFIHGVFGVIKPKWEKSFFFCQKIRWKKLN